MNLSASVLLFLALLIGQPPTPKSDAGEIRLPEVLAPNPPPAPSPNSVQVLGADKYYVIDSDVECFIRTVPGGLLSVAVEAGPIKLPTKLLVEGGKTKFKTFSGKFIYLVEAAASGCCELLIVPKGVAADKEIIQRAIDAQVGPRPPPDPPGPKPKPDPEPAPAPQKLFVSIWYTKSSADPKLAAIIDGEAWRSYCSSGGHGFRVYSDRSAEPEKFDDFKKAFETAGGLPCVVIQTKAGVLLTAVKVPDSEAKLVELLKKWGG